MQSAARLGMVLGLIAAGAAAAQAQGARSGVGAQVGYSRADLSGSDADQVRSRQGALTGVYLSAPLSGILSARPELLFALKGGRTAAILEGGGSVLLDIELAYLELPLLLRLSLPTGSVRPVLFTGPAPALQIGCDLALVVPGAPVRATCDEAEFDVIRKVDIGFVAGGGVEWRWSQASLGLEARYTSGVRSIIDGSDVRNQAIGILVSLTF